MYSKFPDEFCMLLKVALGYCWVNTPFDDAICPALLSSCSVARLSARAKALNVASTMW